MKNKLTVAAALLTALCLFGGCSEKDSVIIINVEESTESDGDFDTDSNILDNNENANISSEDNSDAFSVDSAATESGGELSSDNDNSDTDSEDYDSSGGVSTTAPPSESISENITESILPNVNSSQSGSSGNSDGGAVSGSTSDSTASSSNPSKTTVSIAPSTGINTYKTLNYSEVRGVWISYLEISSMSSGSESAFRSSIGAVFDNCVSMGLNTVYVHVRSHGDAYYDSDYFPKTKHISGNFDALKIMVDEAHKRDLSFQAWINPLRMCEVSDIERENGYPIYNWKNEGTRLVQVGSYYYLNPAYSDVIELISNGAREIVANYDVDGLHIDDYFYPTTETYFDSAAYQNSSYTSLSDFRFANCDKLVSGLYSAVKSANSNALFGVSCQGSLENNYNQMYADVKKWCSNYGYTDYIMPQIYYGFSNSAQPYSKCLSTWNTIAQNGKIPLIVGIAVSKIGLEDTWAGAGKTEWITDSEILKRQFCEAFEQPSYGGVCLYSYKSIFAPDSSVKSQVDKEISALKAAMD